MQEDSAVPSRSTGFASAELEKLRDEARDEKISDDFFSLSLRCPEEMKPPMLARVRRKLSLPLGKLQAEFLEQVGRLGFELPEENVTARRRGTLPPGSEDEGGCGYGDTCDYLFGRGENGEYVDYYIAHRIWGDRHVRIWETGETENLEIFSVMFSPPEEVSEIGGRLGAKGFSPTY